MLNFCKKNKYLIILFALFFLLYFIPYAVFPFTGGSDFYFHFNRIFSLSENIKHGKPFFPIYHSTLYNYGYANPLFYGDLLLYPLAILLSIGVSHRTVSVLSVYMGPFFTIITSYYVGKKIFKSNESAFIFTFFYVFSSYLALDTTYRFALGETYAAIFVPLIMLGFWSILFDNKKNWLFLPIGLSLCVNTHILTSVLCVIVMIIVSIFCFNNLLKDKDRIKLLFISALLFVCLSSYFIFPMIEQLLSTKFLSTTGQSSTVFGTMKERAFPTKFIFSDFNLLLDKDNAYFYWIPNGIGLFPIFLIFFAIIFKNNIKASFYKLYFVGCIFLFSITHRFPWDLFQKYLGIIQFPWRLLLFATIFFSLSAAELIKELANKKQRIVLYVLCFVSLFSFFMTNGVKYKEMYNVFNNPSNYIYYYSYKIGSGEYLPALQNKDGIYMNHKEIISSIEKRSETVSSNNLDVKDISFNRDYGDIYVKYRNNTNNNTYIDVPLLMYKGYKAFDLNNNEELNVSYGELNTVRVYLNENSGNFVVKYERTIIQKLSLLVSLFTIISLVTKKFFLKNTNYHH